MYNEEKCLMELVDKKIKVTLFLMNGFRMDGIITGFDQKTIYFYSDEVGQLIYKHAISTVKPYK